MSTNKTNKRLVAGVNASFINLVTANSTLNNPNFTSIEVDPSGLSIKNVSGSSKSAAIELDPPVVGQDNVSLTNTNDILKQANLNTNINIETEGDTELLFAKKENGLNVLTNAKIVNSLSSDNSNIPVQEGDKKILVLKKSNNKLTLDTVDSSALTGGSGNTVNHAMLSLVDNTFLNNNAFNYNNNNRIYITGTYNNESNGNVMILNSSNQLIPSTLNVNNVAALNTNSLVNYSTTATNNNLYASLSGNNNFSGTNIFSNLVLNSGGVGKLSLSVPSLSNNYTLKFPAAANLSASTWVLSTTSTGMNLDLSWVDLAGLYLTKVDADNKFLTQNTASITYLTQNIANSDYLKKNDASSTYLTQTNAASTYLTQNVADNDYLQKTDAGVVYLNKTDAGLTYLTKTMASSTYLSLVNAASTYLSQESATNTYLTQNNADSNYLKKSDAIDLYDTIATAKTITGAKTYDVANPITILNPGTNLSASTTNEKLLSIDASGVVKSTNLSQNNIATLNTSSLSNYSTTTATNTTTDNKISAALSSYSTTTQTNTTTDNKISTALSNYTTTTNSDTKYVSKNLAETITGTKTFDYSVAKLKLNNTSNDNTSNNKILLLNTTGEVVPCDKTYSLLNSTLASGALTNVANTFTAAQTFTYGNLILNGIDSFNVTLNASQNATSSYSLAFPIGAPSGTMNVLTTSGSSPFSQFTWTDLSTYLTSAAATSTYLTQSNAASTYLTQSNATSTYLTSATAASTYLTQSNATSTYMSLTNTNSNSAANTWSGNNIFNANKFLLAGNGGNLTLNASQTAMSAYSLEFPTAAPSGTMNVLTTSGSSPFSKFTWTDLSTYLTSATAASTYLTQSNATSTYLTSATAASTYLTQANAASTYLTQSNATSTYLTSATAASTYLTQANATSTYAKLSSANTFAAANTFNNSTGGIVLSNTTNDNTTTNQILVLNSSGKIVPCDKTYSAFTSSGALTNTTNTFTATQTFNGSSNPIVVNNLSSSAISDSDLLLTLDTSGNLKKTGVKYNQISNLISTNTPIYQFKFEQNINSSGSSSYSNSAYSGTFTYNSSGKYGYCLQTSGSLTNPLTGINTSSGNNITVTGWVYVNATSESLRLKLTSSGSFFFMMYDSTKSTTGFNNAFYLNEVTGYSSSYNVGLNNPDFSQSANINKWWFFGFSWNSSTLTLSLYISDGGANKYTISKTYTSGDSAFTNALNAKFRNITAIDFQYTSNGTFVDDLRFYNTVLSTATLDSLAQASTDTISDPVVMVSGVDQTILGAKTYTGNQIFNVNNLLLNGGGSANITLNGPNVSSAYTWVLPSTNPTSGTTNVLTTSSTSSPYSLSWTDLASTYLTITNAASTYLTQTNAASTYLTQTNATSTYMKLTGTNSNSATNTFTATNTFNNSTGGVVLSNTTNDTTSTNNVLVMNSSGKIVPCDKTYSALSGGGTSSRVVPLPYEQIDLQNTSKTAIQRLQGTTGVFSNANVSNTTLLAPAATTYNNFAYGYYCLAQATAVSVPTYTTAPGHFFTFGGQNAQVKTMLMWVNTYNVQPDSRSLFMQIRGGYSTSDYGGTNVAFYFALNQGASTTPGTTGFFELGIYDTSNQTPNLTNSGYVNFLNLLPFSTDNSAVTSGYCTDKNWHLIGFAYDTIARKIYCYCDGVRTGIVRPFTNTSSGTAAANNIFKYPYYIMSIALHNNTNVVVGNSYYFADILTEAQCGVIYNNYVNQPIV